MMKVNDFQKYLVTLRIPYEDYFSLIYESKHMLEARLGSDRNFVAEVPMYGNNRKRAVAKAVQWFSKEFKGLLGPAHKVMTVDDPFEEVCYGDDFACNDLANKYLDELTIERVLEEAGGELDREESEVNTQHNCLKRLKRRKKKNLPLTSRLYQTPGGTIYYRMSEPGSTSSAKMKITSIKLSSKSLDKALREVDRRGLNKFENFDTKKPSRSRKLYKRATKKAA